MNDWLMSMIPAAAIVGMFALVKLFRGGGGDSGGDGGSWFSSDSSSDSGGD